MSLSDEQFIAWLKSPSRRLCVLFEAVASVGGVETTRYLSDTGYTTRPTDAPADTYYAPRIIGGGRVIERLSRDGGPAAMSFGDVELNNADRALDGWLADVWANRSGKMWVGDVTWPRADFRLVFDGINANLLPGGRPDVLHLAVRDKLQRLNTAVTETKLGGASTNADRLVPIALGEFHNVEPLLADKATLTYQVNGAAIEDVIEVRDGGAPVAITKALADGKFSLNQASFWVVTCSVQGGKLAGVYVKTVAKLVELLATQYGTDPFDAGDLDAANLATFDAAHPQPVGRPLLQRENVLAVCQEIAASVGAQVVMSATGTLRLIKIALPATGTPTSVTEAMMTGSLQIAERVPVQAAIRLGYCRNWTPQSGLQTGIPAEHKDLFAQEWLTSTARDAGVAADHKLTQEPVQQVDTLLQVKADADAEAARRVALWKEPRTVYSYDGAPQLLLEELGGYQTLTHSDFDLAGGADGQIVAIERDWLNATVRFEVLV